MILDLVLLYVNMLYITGITGVELRYVKEKSITRAQLI